MSHYYLPQHVHACFAANRTVFLDMRRGRYFGLDPEQTQRLRHALEDAEPQSLASPIAAELIGMGLLTTSPDASKTFLPPAAHPPEVSLLPLVDEPPRISTTLIVRFLATCSSVALRLKLRPLEHSLSHLAHRKSQGTTHLVADGTLDEARDLTRSFMHLRPFVYAARNRCLLDSLTLAEWLASHGIAATCVFAVRANPFEAHCWVQIGGHVVNETPEMARRYVPLLCV